MSAPSASQIGDRIVPDATCAGCGCACDDIELAVRGGRIVEARQACSLGEAWFADVAAPDGTGCLLDGRPCGLDEGIERAAQILAGARYPLVYGLEQTSCEAVRLAAGIADWIGGLLDTTSGGGPAATSFHGGGEATCSLGEIANRADLLLVWHADPLATHPRHFDRYSLAPSGRFVPGGRADRTCIVVDTARTPSAGVADAFLELRVGAEFEALWILRALVRGVELAADDVLGATGVALSAWQELCGRLLKAKYAVILFQAGPRTGTADLQADALFGLVRDLNAHTRAAAAPLGAPGNAAGAASFVCARTGAPSAVSLARGFPRYGPGEYSAEAVLARGEADAALLVAVGTPRLSPAAQARLDKIPRVTIDAALPARFSAAAVAFVTAPFGRAAGGTVFRMDGVPLPLRPALAWPQPSDVEILARLEARVKQLCAVPRRQRAAARP